MISEQHFIKMRDEIEIHSQIKEVGSPIWLIATHGIGEHLGRHSYLGELFSGKMNIFQYDLRGHGLSMGRPAHVEDFWDYMHDLEELLLFLKKRYKMERFVLFAHSMGALITAGLLQRLAHRDLYPELIFLNAPPVGIYGSLGKIVDMIPGSLFSGLAGLSASFKVSGLVNLDYLSHDARVKEQYINDPKNAVKVHTKLLLELVKASKEVFSEPIRPQCPAYVTWGSGDRVVGVKAMQDYFSKIETNFIVKEFSEAYHEIHNEVERFRDSYLNYIVETLKPLFYENT